MKKVIIFASYTNFTYSTNDLKDGTAAFSAFVESQVPTMTKFYFFDILSPRKIMEIHQKPILEERGP